MGGRFDRSLRLFSASWSVLREDKKLVLFPVISALSGLAVMATFAVPIFMMFVHGHTESTYSATQGAWVNQYSLQMDPLGWVLTGIGYFVLIYVGIFCNAALIVAANERLTGTGPGSLGSGFRGAGAKAGAFVPWAMLSATVTLALRMLEERMGLIGRIVVSLVGLAWTLITYLVVPILVLEEGYSTGSAVKRSSRLFKETWGENVIGNAGFGIFSLLLVLSGFVIALIGVAIGSTAGLVLFAVLAVAWVLVGSEVLAAMSGIYRVALYRYAVDGAAPRAFVAFDFDGAFRAKRSTGLFSSPGSRTIYRSTPPGTDVRRDAWREWQPPKNDVDAEFGIDIPGAHDLPENRGRPGAAGPQDPPPPPAPF